MEVTRYISRFSIPYFSDLHILTGGIFFALKVPEHGQTTYLSLEVIRPSISNLYDQLTFIV